MTYPTPNREGHYWAKLVRPTDPDLCSTNWEVVQVFDNNGGEFRAFSPGVEGSQSLDAFQWGPRVVKPAGLAGI